MSTINIGYSLSDWSSASPDRLSQLNNHKAVGYLHLDCTKPVISRKLIFFHDDKNKTLSPST